MYMHKRLHSVDSNSEKLRSTKNLKYQPVQINYWTKPNLTDF